MTFCNIKYNTIQNEKNKTIHRFKCKPTRKSRLWCLFTFKKAAKPIFNCGFTLESVNNFIFFIKDCIVFYITKCHILESI